MSIIFYKRPDYISRPDGPLNKAECEVYSAKYQYFSGKTPPELCFENIIENKALPPCMLRDFMDYLVYVERSAENLQFYLWLRDYTRRFDALSPNQKALSPIWTGKESTTYETTPARRVKQASFSKQSMDLGSVSYTSVSPLDEKRCETSWLSMKDTFFTAETPLTLTTMNSPIEETNTGTGVKSPDASAQPMRDEVTKAISHYLLPGSPRELNVSHGDRCAVLHALERTTHPSAFSLILPLIEGVLRGQAHPNFIRWSVCNGNMPKVIFLRTGASVTASLGVVALILLTLSSTIRWWRIAACLPVWCGMSAVIASKKGLCMALTLQCQRDLKPWEDNMEDLSMLGIASTPLNLSPSSRGNEMRPHDREGPMDAWGKSNAWDQEPWVAKYSKRMLIRKTFPGTTRIHAEGIKTLQRKIMCESLATALVITIAVGMCFTVLPSGGFY